MKTALIYDLEIVKGVPMRNEIKVEGIEYCEGWNDHANMGVSVLCAYDEQEDRVRVFCKDNWHEFVELCQKRKPLVSFNGIGFDNKVISAVMGHSIVDADCYDILAELWSAAGLGRTFRKETHGGFKLDDVARVNFGIGKTGNGAIAPVEWQRGNIGSVIDYCVQDIKLTKRCFDRIRGIGGLRDPRDGDRFLTMRKP